jgi:DNA-binding NarL/FixJ family response regulator
MAPTHLPVLSHGSVILARISTAFGPLAGNNLHGTTHAIARIACTCVVDGVVAVSDHMPKPSPDAGRRPEALPLVRQRTAVVSLVLADSLPIFLAGMEHIFRSVPGFRVLACCTEASETARAVRRHVPDVLLLDLDIAGQGLKVLQDLSAAGLATRVVVLASKLTEHEMVEVFRLGARGILLKHMDRRLVIQCIRKVHAGARWLEKASMDRAIEQLLRHQASSREAAAVLTAREFQIVRLIAAGRLIKEIADTLAISDGTVKAHLHHIYGKLGVKGRLELILYARDRDLFSPFLPDGFPGPSK